MPILTVAERIGTEIEGKYKVEALLGQGGMGVVFAARHLWTERRVAIKLLRPELSALTLLESTRLIQEARTTTRLEHPHVVQVLDMGRTDDGVPYLVMERLEGVTLKQELEARGRLSAHEALQLLLPLMGAMALAHDQGIIHRDLKPANIFLCRNAAGG
jgi:serine/threonine protein kinase